MQPSPKSSAFHLITWNVNSLKTLNQYHPWTEMKAARDILNHLKANVICFQETKMARDKITETDWALVEGYDAYFAFSKLRKGLVSCWKIKLSFINHTGDRYSGVVTFVRKTPAILPVSGAWDGFESFIREYLSESEDVVPEDWLVDIRQMDAEGRIVITDHEFFLLFNLYCPNETSGERMPFKMRFYQVLEYIIRELHAKQKHFIIATDLNIVHRPIDHCDPATSIKDHGLKEFGDHPARKWLDSFLSTRQAVDVFRQFFPEREKAFTCWNTLINARPINFGTRLDYFLTDPGLMNYVKHCDIMPDIMGSDHCPVELQFKDDFIDLIGEREPALSASLQLQMSAPVTPGLCSCYYEEYSGKQKNILHFFSKQTSVKRGSVAVAGASVQEISTAVPAKPKKQKLTDFFERKTKETKSEEEACSQVTTNHSLEPEAFLPEQVPDDFKTLDQKQAKLQWNSLPFGKPPSLPTCEHGEPVKEYTVKKPGPNQGRKFYMCARPGAIDKADPNSRCNFFQWRNGQSSLTSKAPFKKTPAEMLD